MTRCASSSCTAVLLLFCSLSLPAWGQQHYLYEPKPVTAEESNKSSDGILVTELSIQKGDTLFDISRKYSGRGMYYPQILLFNKIKDPNLIYTGDTLKIPLTKDGVRAESLAVKDLAAKARKHKGKNQKVASPKSVMPKADQKPVAGLPVVAPDAAIHGKSAGNNIAGRKGGKAESEKTVVSRKTETVPGVAGDSAKGQKLFEDALKSYRQNDFRSALELFDRYLAENPDSPLAPDASLYQAECYLKLSAQ